MVIKIENYKGHEIVFNTSDDNFYCLSVNKNGKGSIKNIRKEIDEHEKKNSEFEPFKVVNPHSLEILTICSIRKDGDYSAVYETGEKIRITQWDEGKYRVFDEEELEIFKQIKQLNEEESKEINKIEQSYRDKVEVLSDKIKSKYLRDIHKKIY